MPPFPAWDVSRASTQSDLTPGGGDALAAAVASVLGVPLAETPNFVKAPEGYLRALCAWLAPRGLTFVKVPLLPEDGTLPFDVPAPEGAPALVVVAGRSPRSTPEHAFKHCAVGAVSAAAPRSVTVLFDPHPSRAGLDQPLEWVGFFAATAGRSS